MSKNASQSLAEIIRSQKQVLMALTEDMSNIWNLSCLIPTNEGPATKADPWVVIADALQTQ